MRTRYIKPGFFKDDKLCELPPLARILFEGLWCLADREGRLEYRPKRIKIEILPYDDCNVEELLGLLESEFIYRYSVDGIEYVQIRNFTKHQRPHPNEEGICPAPEQIVNNHDSIVNNHERVILNRDSGYSYSYSKSISNNNKEEGKKKEEVKRKEEEEEKRKEESGFLEDFEDWWEDYPNKQGKERAKQHYITWRRKGKTPEELKQALRRYLAVKRKQKSETYSNGSTFLNPLPRGDSANINDYLEATPETMTESERMEMLDEMEKHRQFLESMNPEEKRRYYEAKGKHFKRFDGGDRLCEGGGKERGAGGEELLQSPL
ncbi:MAG: hypothetical protein WC194_12980 [Mesotoga sp.]|uniref:hypothetical protein n=1 Tax=Mesotoga sp. TaxID=2053577 RepID=UPI003564A3CD